MLVNRSLTVVEQSACLGSFVAATTQVPYAHQNERALVSSYMAGPDIPVRMSEQSMACNCGTLFGAQ